MTEVELQEFFYLNLEIKHLEKELEDLKNQDLYKSPTISDLPKGNKIDDEIAKYIATLIDLENGLQRKLIKLYAQKNRIEDYINSINNAEIRLIMRLRHIKSMTWRAIGNEICMTESAVRKKHNKFLKLDRNDGNDARKYAIM